MPGCSFTFIHCADLHLGSRFIGLGAQDNALAATLAEAPFAAFKRIADLAIKERVKFLTVSGDVFEDFTPPLRLQYRFADELFRLRQAEIPVFIIAGNHDPLSCEALSGVHFPDNTTLFPAQPETVSLDRGDGTMIHIAGCSYENAAEYRDISWEIAKAFPETPGVRIALLHTALGSADGVNPYAPASVPELCSSGVDAWLLGHTHSYTVVNRAPFILYSGTPQGRNINENGRHGAALVTVDENNNFDSRFIPLDLQQFEKFTLDISGLETPAALPEKIAGMLDGFDFDAHTLLFRLELCGTTPLDSKLRNENPEALHEFLSGALPGGAILEKVILNTAKLLETDPELTAGLKAVLDDLKKNSTHRELAGKLAKLKRHIPQFSDSELDEICDRALQRVIAALAGKDGS